MDIGQPVSWNIIIRQMAASICGLSMLAVHIHYRRRASRREDLPREQSSLRREKWRRVLAWLRYPSVISWIAAAAVFLVSPESLQAWQFPFGSIYTYGLGGLMCVAGTALFLMSHRRLGEFWSIEAAVKKGHRVIQEGPYRFIRHPLYAGLYLITIGLTLLISSYVMLIPLTLSVGFYHQAVMEERLLKAALGREYEEYAERTGMFLPGIRLRIRF